jgi:hypothetical protein
MLWYGHGVTSERILDVSSIVVNSTAGRLSVQHQANLRALLQLVADIGFEKFTLRFAAKGANDPSTWVQGLPEERAAWTFSTAASVESAGTAPCRQTTTVTARPIVRSIARMGTGTSSVRAMRRRPASSSERDPRVIAPHRSGERARLPTSLCFARLRSESCSLKVF